MATNIFKLTNYIILHSFVLLTLTTQPAIFENWKFNLGYGFVAFFICLYFFYQTVFLGPGDLAKERVVQLPENAVDPEEYCSVCEFQRPPRAKHCKICQTCIPKYDHHCPFLSVCIGLNNHHSFLSFLFFEIQLTLIALNSIFPSFQTANWIQTFFLYVCLLMSLAFFLVCVLLFSLHCYLAMKDITTYEMFSTSAKQISYNKGKEVTFINGKPSELVTVHIIAHSHDDAGWLKTVDDYFYGRNNYIYNASVQLILDQYMGQLQEKSSRKFSQVEQVFFSKWYNTQNAQTKTQVKNFLQSGQLQFISGGWVMNDEACPPYTGIIDQMTLGHQYLKAHFGYVPKIGWQIDPFGHGAATAALFIKMGFHAHYFCRIDFEDHNLRIQNKELQFWWKPFDSYSEQILSEDLIHHYTPPEGFNFEHGNEPVTSQNVQSRVSDYVNDLYTRIQGEKTNQILVPQGDDFEYQSAFINYDNIEKLMDYINKRIPIYNLKLIWSTPEDYYQAVKGFAPNTWTNNKGDFFPYADHEHAYWTGYYTSRPALKGYIRSRISLLHTVDQFFAFSAPLSGLAFGMNQLPNYEFYQEGSPLFSLRNAASVTMHHDAITGTSRIDVVNDYTYLLFNGTQDALSLVSQNMNSVFNFSAPFDLSFRECPLLNISSCPVLQVEAESQGQNAVMTLFNPLVWNRTEVIRVPLSKPNYQVYDWNNRLLVSDIIQRSASVYELVFQVEVPALAMVTLFLERSNNLPYITPTVPTSDVVLSNQYIDLHFSQVDHKLASVNVSNSQKGFSLHQDLMYYNSEQGGGQASGAYIFRPDYTNAPIQISSKPNWKLIQCKFFQELTQNFGPWANQTFRVLNGTNNFHYEAMIGPIDTFSGGKEVISKFRSTLFTGQNFTTDSNGLELKGRKINWRPQWNVTIQEPVAGNYYPITSSIHITDYLQNLQMAVLTDRARGGSSLKSGEIETMLHRSTLSDDGRGIQRPFDDPSIILAKEVVTINEIEFAARYQRYFSELLQNEMLPLFSTTRLSRNDFFGNTYAHKIISFVTKSIPENLRLETFQLLGLEKTAGHRSTVRFLARLHHLFGAGEDIYYSQPASLDWKTLFRESMMTFVGCSELSLSANQVIAGPANCSSVVNIMPMDFRTFELTFEF